MAGWHKILVQHNEVFTSDDSDVILDAFENGATVERIENSECTELLTCGCSQCINQAYNILEIYPALEEVKS